MMSEVELKEMLLRELDVLETTDRDDAIVRYSIRVELLFDILYDTLDDFTKARVEKAIAKGA